jgi:diadenosine hexaphosphate hydrolase (ATP-forming)
MPAPKKRVRKPIRTVEGAGGVVVNADGRILMIRHKNGTWVFPKGHIEVGESKVDAAVREVEEEAGVVAAIHDPRMTWQTDYVNPRREARRITWYLLTTDATETVQREALFPEGGFFPPNAAMRKLAFDEDRAVLRGALKAAVRAGLVDAEAAAKAGRVPSAAERGAGRAGSGAGPAARPSRRGRRGGRRGAGGEAPPHDAGDAPSPPPRSGERGGDGNDS